MERIRHMWEGKQIGGGSNFVKCSRFVKTVREEGHQREQS